MKRPEPSLECSRWLNPPLQRHHFQAPRSHTGASSVWSASKIESRVSIGPHYCRFICTPLSRRLFILRQFPDRFDVSIGLRRSIDDMNDMSMSENESHIHSSFWF